eukprot:6190928-Pleurochrysis_carterae.AAC.1
MRLRVVVNMWHASGGASCARAHVLARRRRCAYLRARACTAHSRAYVCLSVSVSCLCQCASACGRVRARACVCVRACVPA